MVDAWGTSGVMLIYSGWWRRRSGAAGTGSTFYCSGIRGAGWLSAVLAVLAVCVCVCVRERARERMAGGRMGESKPNAVLQYRQKGTVRRGVLAGVNSYLGRVAGYQRRVIDAVT